MTTPFVDVVVSPSLPSLPHLQLPQQQRSPRYPSSARVPLEAMVNPKSLGDHLAAIASGNLRFLKNIINPIPPRSVYRPRFLAVQKLPHPFPVLRQYNFKNLHRNPAISRTCSEAWDHPQIPATGRHSLQWCVSHPCSVARMAHVSVHRLTDVCGPFRLNSLPTWPTRQPGSSSSRGGVSNPHPNQIPKRE